MVQQTSSLCVRYIWSRYLTTETQYQTVCVSLSVSEVEDYPVNLKLNLNQMWTNTISIQILAFRTSHAKCDLTTRNGDSAPALFVWAEHYDRNLRLRASNCSLIFMKILPSFSPCRNQLQHTIEATCNSTMSTF